LSRPPAVSVAICTRDRLALLKQTLASVYAQTWTDFEVVLVDDGSTDGTGDWIRRRRFPRLKYRRIESSRGLAAARNSALTAARGEFISFLDSDDLWRPRYLERQLLAFARPGIVAALCDYDAIDAAGRPCAWKKHPPVPRELFVRLTGRDSMPPSCTLIARLSALREIGGCDERFRRFADDDLFLRIGERFGPASFAYRDEVLASYRRHPAQMSDILQNRSKSPFLGRKAAALTPGDTDLIIDLILYSRKHGL
jgi:glycosyltransferase involved in cell wall biosynthesis